MDRVYDDICVRMARGEWVSFSTDEREYVREIMPRALAAIVNSALPMHQQIAILVDMLKCLGWSASQLPPDLAWREYPAKWPGDPESRFWKYLVETGWIDISGYIKDLAGPIPLPVVQEIATRWDARIAWLKPCDIPTFISQPTWHLDVLGDLVGVHSRGRWLEGFVAAKAWREVKMICSEFHGEPLDVLKCAIQHGHYREARDIVLPWITAPNEVVEAHHMLRTGVNPCPRNDEGLWNYFVDPRITPRVLEPLVRAGIVVPTLLIMEQLARCESRQNLSQAALFSVFDALAAVARKERMPVSRMQQNIYEAYNEWCVARRRFIQVTYIRSSPSSPRQRRIHFWSQYWFMWREVWYCAAVLVAGEHWRVRSDQLTPLARFCRIAARLPIEIQAAMFDVRDYTQTDAFTWLLTLLLDPFYSVV